MAPGVLTGTDMSLTVAFTAAFFAGPPVQTRMGEYSDLQRRHGEKLVQLGGPGWRQAPRETPSPTFSGGGGLTDAVPLLHATWSGFAEDADVKDANRQWLTNDAPPWWPTRARGWGPQSCLITSFEVKVYDLGMAVAAVDVSVRLPRSWVKPATAEAVKDLAALASKSPVTTLTQHLAATTASHYFDAFESGFARDAVDPWLDSFSDPLDDADDGGGGDDWGRFLWLHPAIRSKGKTIDDYGRLLWLHPVLMYEGEKVLSTARQLAPPFRRSMGLQGGRFLPGVSWSVIAAEPGRTEAFEVPRQLLEDHWAYFALYMHLDRALGEELIRGRWHEGRRLKDRERDADRLFGYYEQVMELRRRLESMPVSRGGDEVAMWQAIAAVQKFDELVETVERKGELLWRVSERAVQRAEADRVRRTSVILGGLTALTVVTVAVALTGNFLGGLQGSGNSAWRVLIVAVAMLISVSIWWAVSNEGTWRSPDARRAA